MRQAPLFLALTRPPMMWGIPFVYWSLWITVSGLLFLFLPFKPVVFISVGIYAAMWTLSQYEPNFGRLLLVKFHKTPRTKTKSDHGGNLYRA